MFELFFTIKYPTNFLSTFPSGKTVEMFLCARSNSECIIVWRCPSRCPSVLLFVRPPTILSLDNHFESLYRLSSCSLCKYQRTVHTSFSILATPFCIVIHLVRIKLAQICAFRAIIWIMDWIKLCDASTSCENRGDTERRNTDAKCRNQR